MWCRSLHQGDGTIIYRGKESRSKLENHVDKNASVYQWRLTRRYVQKRAAGLLTRALVTECLHKTLQEVFLSRDFTPALGQLILHLRLGLGHELDLSLVLLG